MLVIKKIHINLKIPNDITLQIFINQPAPLIEKLRQIHLSLLSCSEDYRDKYPEGIFSETHSPKNDWFPGRWIFLKPLPYCIGIVTSTPDCMIKPVLCG